MGAHHPSTQASTARAQLPHVRQKPTWNAEVAVFTNFEAMSRKCSLNLHPVKNQSQVLHGTLDGNGDSLHHQCCATN